ncbi:hypothetical protein V8B97DRAFT_1988454 [Scleroderma yunnanense]
MWLISTVFSHAFLIVMPQEEQPEPATHITVLVTRSVSMTSSMFILGHRSSGIHGLRSVLIPNSISFVTFSRGHWKWTRQWFSFLEFHF